MKLTNLKFLLSYLQYTRTSQQNRSTQNQNAYLTRADPVIDLNCPLLYHLNVDFSFRCKFYYFVYILRGKKILS